MTLLSRTPVVATIDASASIFYHTNRPLVHCLAFSASLRLGSEHALRWKIFEEHSMETLIVSQSEVAQLLPMDECVAVMEQAFRALAGGDAILPLRPVMWLPERVGALAMMPSYLGGLHAV